MRHGLAVAAVIAMAACGAEGDGEELGVADEAASEGVYGLMACQASTAGGGTIGTSTVSTASTLSIASISADGTGVLTVRAFDTAGWSGVGPPGVQTTKLISLGNGMTATGSFGAPGLMAYITSITSNGNSVTFGGTQLGTDNIWRTVTGTLVLGNGAFDGVSGSGFSRLTYLSASAGALSTLGLVSASPVSYTSTTVYYATTACAGYTAQESGSAGSVTLSVTAPGAIGVTYLIDSNVSVSGGAAPFTVAYNSQPLANGAHTLKARASDETGNRMLTPAVSFSLANDKTGPTVTGAVSGSTGTITLSASASDPSGVAKVEFLIDSVVRASVVAAPYVLSYNSLQLANGAHTLVARATDGVGNVASAAGVAFTTANDLTGPVTALTITGTSGVLTLNATAADVAGVARVDFRWGTSPIGSDTSAPYAMTFDSRKSANGNLTLYADAYDALGNKTTVSKSVTVNNVTTAEVEVNNTVAAATLFAATAVKASGYTSPTNPDFFKVAVAAGRTLRVETVGSGGTAYVDLALFDAAGNQLGVSATVGSSSEVLSTTNGSAASVNFYVKVMGQSGGPAVINYFVLVDR